MELAKKLVLKPGVAIKLAKQSLNNTWQKGLQENLSLEMDVFTKTFDTEDMVEGVDAFLSKRKPEFKHK